jgi:RND family efflux transporter MFP subunit
VISKTTSDQLLKRVSAALFAGACAFVVGCSEEKSASTASARGGESRAVPVVAEAVKLDKKRTKIEAVGTARALHSVDVYAEAAGEVVEINFQPGDAVEAGDVLLALDARDETLALELAELRLGEAERQLKRYETANASARRTVPESTVDAARTALESARVERDIAELALARRSVTAAFDGYVGITEIDVGDRIDTSTLITTLDDRSSLLVRFDVPEAYVRSIELGQPVVLEVWSGEPLEAYGRVVDLGSRIDPVSRAFVARAQVSNSADQLRPGMSFRVKLDLDDGAFPAVPELAVQWGADGAYVWAVNDEGRAARVPVRLVQRSGGRVLVDAPLDAGDRVVAEGVQSMREGVGLRLMDAEALARDARTVLGATGPHSDD